jgi:hypothetical protein
MFIIGLGAPPLANLRRGAGGALGVTGGQGCIDVHSYRFAGLGGTAAGESASRSTGHKA